MQPAIDAVRRGLTRFTDEIIQRDISARYMIVMYGLFPEIILDWYFICFCCTIYLNCFGFGFILMLTWVLLLILLLVLLLVCFVFVLRVKMFERAT